MDLSAADSLRDPDLYHDAVTALLERQPATPEEASQIVQRVRWTHQRHRRRDQRYAGDLPERETDDSDQGGRSAPTPVTDAVQRLPEHLRKVMLLRFVSERSVTEVAATMHVSVPTIVRWTKQAMDQIRNGDL
jgi:DNA-directed RNA polymerase specialized sigma24 family protein